MIAALGYGSGDGDLLRARTRRSEIADTRHTRKFLLSAQNQAPFVQNVAVYEQKPPPFICPTAWDKRPKPWERLFPAARRQKSGATGVSKITSARRRARAHARSAESVAATVSMSAPSVFRIPLGRFCLLCMSSKSRGKDINCPVWEFRNDHWNRPRCFISTAIWQILSWRLNFPHGKFAG